MRSLIHTIFLLLLSVITFAQTVHVDSDRVVYKGTVKIDHVSKDELYARAKNSILSPVKGSKQIIIADDAQKGMLAAKGSIKLSSPYHIIKTVEYILELSVDDGKYKYRIDSVYLKQTERGGKTEKISSEKLLKGMEINQPVSGNTEKLLNEIDMNFQKLLDLLRADMKGIPVKKN